MHPAYSVIIFTTLSGAGYGLAIALGLNLLDPQAAATKAAHVLALLMIAGGLLSSTLHLGNPQRAWRAFSQWRSSWLSREGVLAVASFVPMTVNAGNALLFGEYNALSGAVAVVLALATVFCTAMIYASLRSVDAWHTRLTPACYLLFALAGGAVLASLFASGGGGRWPLLPGVAIVLLGAAWFAKWRWRERLIGKPARSTPETATGLGQIGKVRLLERPHMTENYLTREMGFRVARKHAGKLVAIAFLAGGVAPAVLLAGAVMSGTGGAVALAFSAAVAHLGGILAERWLFFAEARHAVMNYYGG